MLNSREFCITVAYYLERAINMSNEPLTENDLYSAGHKTLSIMFLMIMVCGLCLIYLYASKVRKGEEK